jgi:hypothetical protein
LTRKSRNDAIHESAPRCAVERDKVRPDRRFIERSFFHKRGKLAGCTGFPLHVTNGSMLVSEILECGTNTFSEHPDSGTQLDGM